MDERKVFDAIWRRLPLNVRAIGIAIGAAIIGWFCAMCAGCANIVNHVDDRYNLRPYCGTVDDADVIATAFRSPRGPEGTQAKAFAIILLPLSIIDLPLEVVADTVTLPYDLYKHSKD